MHVDRDRESQPTKKLKKKLSLIVEAQILAVGNWLNLIPVSCLSMVTFTNVSSHVVHTNTHNSISIFHPLWNEIISAGQWIEGQQKQSERESTIAMRTADTYTFVQAWGAEERGNSTEIRDSWIYDPLNSEYVCVSV